MLGLKHTYYKILGLIMLLFTLQSEATAQLQPEAPPRPIKVYARPLEGLRFGAFYQGTSGGTVTVNADGSRSVTGDVIQMNLGIPFSPAIFDVDANPGTVVSILNGPDVWLTGSHGGSILLHLEASDRGNPFISTAIPPAYTEVRIGGTLTLGPPAANPPGEYSGSFSIIFNHE